MTATQFCHWFHGFLSLENPEFISAAQTQIVKDHLALVFNKVTPHRSSPINPKGDSAANPFYLDPSKQFNQTNPASKTYC